MTIMAKPSDAPGFKRLAAEWNKKLAASGFRDIEQQNQRLKKTGTEYRYQMADPAQISNRAKYFEIIGQKIWETTFDSEQERQILTYYFEGISQTKIKDLVYPPVCRFTVYKRIDKWLRRWGLK